MVGQLTGRPATACLASLSPAQPQSFARARTRLCGIGPNEAAACAATQPAACAPRRQSPPPSARPNTAWRSDPCLAHPSPPRSNRPRAVPLPKPGPAATLNREHISPPPFTRSLPDDGRTGPSFSGANERLRACDGIGARPARLGPSARRPRNREPDGLAGRRRALREARSSKQAPAQRTRADRGQSEQRTRRTCDRRRC